MTLLDVVWDEGMEKAIRDLFFEMRRTLPPLGDCSTPELLAVEWKKERERAREFVQHMKFILERKRKPALDLGVMGAMERLKLKALPPKGEA